MKLWLNLSLVVCLCLVALAADTGKKSTSCPCGWANRGRIVGGKYTQPNEYPWIVMLVFTKGMTHFCAGSIINEKIIISAAHCAHSALNKKVSIIAGSSDVNKPGQIVPVSNILIHEKYDNDDYAATKYDIAFFNLANPLNFNTRVGPVCLPSGKLNLDNLWVKMIGWGRTGGPQLGTTQLKEVDLQVLPLKKCKEYHPALPTPQIQICTLTTGKGGCNGDSGGPVVYLDPETNRYTLVGLVSFGSPYCDTGVPTVSTDVSSFLDWIKTKAKTSGCQKI